MYLHFSSHYMFDVRYKLHALLAIFRFSDINYVVRLMEFFTFFLYRTVLCNCLLHKFLLSNCSMDLYGQFCIPARFQFRTDDESNAEQDD